MHTGPQGYVHTRVYTKVHQRQIDCITQAHYAADIPHTHTHIKILDGLCWEKKIKEKENKMQYFLVNSFQAINV